MPVRTPPLRDQIHRSVTLDSQLSQARFTRFLPMRAWLTLPCHCAPSLPCPRLRPPRLDLASARGHERRERPSPPCAHCARCSRRCCLALSVGPVPTVAPFPPQSDGQPDEDERQEQGPASPVPPSKSEPVSLARTYRSSRLSFSSSHNSSLAGPGPSTTSRRVRADDSMCFLQSFPDD